MNTETGKDISGKSILIRLLLHFIIAGDYCISTILLITAAGERWNLAEELHLCALLMTTFSLTLLAAIFRTKKHFSPLLPWIFALTGLVTGVTAVIISLLR